MKLGIVGLPNVGKSTLFNAITRAGADAANYPFCTIDPNVGVVTVPDERIDALHRMYDSKKTIYTAIEFYDIAGLVKGASKGEGLGNKFLGHIREVAAIVHVVRCFDDDNVVHVNGAPDPASDIETINLELIFSDIELLERRREKTAKSLKGDKGLQKEFDLLTKVKDGLETGKPARALDLSDDERGFVSGLDLLTSKPVIYAANVAEEDAASGEGNAYVAAVKRRADAEGSDVVVISAKVESELAELTDEERDEFIEGLGIGESGLEKLIKASYHLLDLISYLTAGEPEVRAWTIKRGTKAPQAAGKIHTDFEKGFIRAETISYDDLMACGSLHAARDKGLVRSEGKEYVVKDGDVMHFLFNV
ncbi:MAG: redox-regulated ATPase YchF [Clostridiales Family XIII bacterium]|jgi:GTP-binding protein YchF|nr:redox-regulated ATPase YchF [Clostridiales Family XIII bacterium]